LVTITIPELGAIANSYKRRQNNVYNDFYDKLSPSQQPLGHELASSRISRKFFNLYRQLPITIADSPLNR
jgi:hypothetical protein